MPMSSTCQPDVTIDDHLDEAHERGLAEDVLDGLTRPFKELPPKHFYDARGCELFDRDHRAARVLPDARGARDPQAQRGGDRRRDGRRRAGRARLRHGREDARAARRDGAPPASCAATCPFDVAESVVRASAEALVDEYPGLRVHGVDRRLRAPPRPHPAADAGRAADRRAARRHDRQLPARQPPPAAARDRRAARPRRPPAARHRPRQGPGTCSRPPTTTRPA